MSDPVDSDDVRWLAAEFALGVLKGERLREAQRRFASESAFREDVEIWQDQLSPLLDEIDPETPSPQVWRNIESQLFGKERKAGGGLWESLRFWRSFSLVAGTLAVASMAAVLVLPGTGLLPRTGGGEPLVATLTASGEAPAFLARFDPTRSRMIVRVAAGDSQSQARVPELWLIPGDGVPRSLGLLDEAGTGEISIRESIRELVRDGAALAVSLEPAGGSPTGAPTGPVVASGTLQAL